MAKAQTTIGAMHERIRIEAMSPVKDAIGAEKQTWNSIGEMWAEVTPSSGNERFHRDQMQASVDWKVVIRYRSNVIPQQRVIVLSGQAAGRTLEIRGTIDDEVRRFQTLLCEELEAP